jgi:hypothetical protein
MQQLSKRRSLVIRDFDYDGNREKLYVTFVSGKTYVYNGVPSRTFEGFARAPSKGTFFDEHIKDHFPSASAALWPPGVRHQPTIN